ncbi:DUF378 domain-containing protein [Halobaculum sp. WSA2]|uniref:DUF378 domain-containing protein n=1 Tax=Halobaculum saliterrae TaxID=2073113 RepID=A0A6B0SN67_9EURY|nr:DUF378 domain-containing protein [Halobaculum saliterrae]MXR39807.1 DUF378 domain-containing protein [Halobaculum saliterrae]
MADVQNPYDSDESAVKVTVWLLAGLGALNWGLMELADLNLVTELVGTGAAGAIYIAIGAAGGLSLAGNFGLDVLGGDE